MSQPPYPPPPPPPPPSYPPYAPAGWSPEEPPRSPQTARRLVVALAVLAAVLVVAIAVLVPVVLARYDAAETGADAPRDLSAVEVYDDLPTVHLAAGEDFDYPQSPPVGGRHARRWAECGVWDAPVPEVNVVHSLEHGTVWITYRADLVGDEGVARLAEQLPDDGIVSPHPDQEAPVVITVWGRQLDLLGVEDPRIALFLAEYGDGQTAPEPMASCHGGLDQAEAGRGSGERLA